MGITFQPGTHFAPLKACCIHNFYGQLNNLTAFLFVGTMDHPDVEAMVQQLIADGWQEVHARFHAQTVHALQARLRAAEEAARIASDAARQTANANQAAADANFPWCASLYAFSCYAPYLVMNCKTQARVVFNLMHDTC